MKTRQTRSGVANPALDVFRLGQLISAEADSGKPTVDVRTDSEALGRLFVRHGVASTMWPARELLQQVHRMLDTPLTELSAAASRSRSRGGWAQTTVRDVLRASRPDSRQLIHVKDSVKRMSLENTGGPSEAVLVIYFLALGVGRRANLRITRLSDESLQTGLQWVLEQSWLTPDLKEWARESIRAVFR